MVCNNWWHISHLYLIFLQQNCHMNNPIQIMYKYILLSCFVWFSRTVVKLVYSYNYYKLYLKAYAYALLSISKMIHEVSRKCYENKGLYRVWVNFGPPKLLSNFWEIFGIILKYRMFNTSWNMTLFKICTWFRYMT